VKNLFHYQAYECSYQTLSSRASGVLITHQPHQWLMFAPSSTTISLHHHLHPHPLRLQLRPLIGNEPLPSIEGCGLNQRHLRSEDSAAAPLPFQRDVGWLIFTRWGNWGDRQRNGGRKKMRGDPGIGRSIQYVTKRTTMESRGSFSLIFHSIPPNDHL